MEVPETGKETSERSVYELYGKEGIKKGSRQQPETPLQDGCIGHHIKTGPHELDEYDWNCYLDFADRHL